MTAVASQNPWDGGESKERNRTASFCRTADARLIGRPSTRNTGRPRVIVVTPTGHPNLNRSLGALGGSHQIRTRCYLI